MTILKIISGGQTSADQGGLIAASVLKIETGGMMPKGFRTEDGPKPELAKKYGLIESQSANYPPRTAWNVDHSDATLWVGDHTSPGGKLTVKLAEKVGKPVFFLPFPPSTRGNAVESIGDLAYWLDNVAPKTLNVAGNRESKNPGITQFTARALELAIRVTAAMQ